MEDSDLSMYGYNTSGKRGMRYLSNLKNTFKQSALTVYNKIHSLKIQNPELLMIDLIAIPMAGALTTYDIVTYGFPPSHLSAGTLLYGTLALFCTLLSFLEIPNKKQ